MGQMINARSGRLAVTGAVGVPPGRLLQPVGVERGRKSWPVRGRRSCPRSASTALVDDPARVHTQHLDPLDPTRTIGPASCRRSPPNALTSPAKLVCGACCAPGDPAQELYDTWTAKECLRDLYTSPATQASPPPGSTASS